MRKSSIVGLLLGFGGLVLLAGCATQAQKPAQEATPEQKARSSVASAFMTGTAPEILSEKVALGADLQALLGLPPGTDGAKIYDALLGLTQGATPKIGEATAEEAQRSREHSPPLFTLSAGDLKLLLHYDLQGNHVDFVESLSAPMTAATPVAETTPVAEAAQPVPMAEPAPPATMAEAARSEPAETVYSVVEPKAPSTARAKRKAQAKPKPKALAKAKPQSRATPVRTAQAAEPQSRIAALKPPTLKPSGPCVIKPVMSDQDLVNCGATPPRY
jgi:hypothetical protein